MKKTRHVISLSEREEDMLEEMAAARGISPMEVIHFFIGEVYKRERPAYIRTMEKAQVIKERQIKLAEQGKPISKRDMTAEDRGRAICEQLEGKVGDSSLACEYKVYDTVVNGWRITSRITPLSLLTDDILTSQYTSGKKGYLKFCKKHKLDPYKMEATN